jgi:hypothetical protein
MKQEINNLTGTQGSVEISLDLIDSKGKKKGNIKYKATHLVDESQEEFSARLDFYQTEALNRAR